MIVHRPFLVVVRNLVPSLGAILESPLLALRFVPYSATTVAEPFVLLIAQDPNPWRRRLAASILDNIDPAVAPKTDSNK